jgi:hypothetical protein
MRTRVLTRSRRPTLTAVASDRGPAPAVGAVRTSSSYDGDARVHIVLARRRRVLCDMASTVYYIGGIVEQAIGKAAPWYVLA